MKTVRGIWQVSLLPMLLISSLFIFQAQGCKEGSSAQVLQAPDARSGIEQPSPPVATLPSQLPNHLEEISPSFEASGNQSQSAAVAHLGLQQHTQRPMVLVFRSDEDFDKLWVMFGMDSEIGIRRPRVNFDKQAVMVVLMDPAQSATDSPEMRQMFFDTRDENLVMMFEGLAPEFGERLKAKDSGMPWYMAVVPQEYLENPPAILFHNTGMASSETTPVF